MPAPNSVGDEIALTEALKTRINSGPLSSSVWECKRTGLFFTVVCVAVREDDLTPCVVYRDSWGVNRVKVLPDFLARFAPLTPVKK